MSAEPKAGPDPRTALRERIVDVLWRMQEERGWIDDAAVRAAADECAMTPSEVEEVATFYNLIHRRPAGRVRIYVCDSISCELNGASALMLRLSETLGITPGEVTEDGAICLLPIVCLGHCDRAPCVMVKNRIEGPVPVDREGLAQKLEEWRR